MIKHFLTIIIFGFLFYGCRSSILDDPTTTIEYSVGQPSNVTVTVENSYNTTIATLEDGYLPAGDYFAVFDMSNLPEGIYFYTVECKGVNSNFYSKKIYHLMFLP